MEYSGAGGTLIHEKNQKQEISWHCPFKPSSKEGVQYNAHLQNPKYRKSTGET